MLKQRVYLAVSGQQAFDGAGKAWDRHELPKPCKVGDVTVHHFS